MIGADSHTLLPHGERVGGVTIAHAGSFGEHVGLIELTPADWRDISRVWASIVPEGLPLVREHAAALRRRGADVVILLSHLGVERDRELAAELDSEISLVIGAHSHTLLPHGERVGGVTIAHAGSFGEHLGRDRARPRGRGANRTRCGRCRPGGYRAASGGAGPEDRKHRGRDRDMARRARRPAQRFVPATALVSPLPAGILTRGTLYDACPSPGVSSVADLTGAQLREIVERGLEAELAAEAPRSLRGARGA